MTIFDGGTLSKQVFRARDQVFQNLPRNLNLRYTGEDVEDRRKPSVRTNATRFLLSLLKFLPTDSKKEFLNQRDIVSALTKDLKDDPPFMVRDILDTLKASVLQDEALPRESKTRIINAQLLSRVSLLYRYDQQDTEISEKVKSVDSISHDFLMLACTSPSIGVLNRQAGFYPRGVDPDEVHDADLENVYIDLGLDSIEWMDKYTEKVPVRNTILSDFIQHLRPWSNTKQSELLLSILKAAPELVAEYFYGKKTFSFDPKLTATWIGYSALIFSSIQIPVPEFFGHQEGYARLPPPTAIVLENILPIPLTPKVLRACLLHEQNLITFFAVRILCIAFTKLQTTLKMYREASSGPKSLWSQAAERLTDEFCARCPSMKDVIFAFRKMSDSDLLQREACTKLLVLYYEVAPRVALDAKFDVSEALAKALTALETASPAPEDRAIRVMELENLFQFAHFSPGMKWFGKMAGFELSPFITMLKLCTEAPRDIPLVKLRSVLESVVDENNILQSQTSMSALDAFILSLRSLKGSANASAVYQFVDNCASRCASKPINYVFALEETQAEVHESEKKKSVISLLTLAMVEQWSFLVKSAKDAELDDASKLLSEHLARSIKIKEDKKVLKLLIEQVVSASPGGSFAQSILKNTKSLVDVIEVPEEAIKPEEVEKNKSKSNVPSDAEKDKIVDTMLEGSKVKKEDHTPLTKWTTKEIDEVIEGGLASSLIMLLSSEHLSVRKEAVISITKLAAKLKESAFEEKDQIWLLLCEVGETAKKIINDEPLPTVISAFASHAIPVLTDPLHCLYAKINKFLSQGPTWELAKIPLLYKVLDEAPTLDDAHYTEMNWLLMYMLAGLRTPADMGIFRKRRVFEKLFSVYNNPYLGAGLREKILRLLFRATTIEGGSTTLITRFSAMTWLQAQVALGGGMPLKVLMERILETSEKKRVGKWSHNGVKDVVDTTLAL